MVWRIGKTQGRQQSILLVAGGDRGGGKGQVIGLLQRGGDPGAETCRRGRALRQREHMGKHMEASS